MKYGASVHKMNRCLLCGGRQVSQNPMTHLGVLALLTGVEKNENSALTTLHVLSVHVIQSIIEKYTEVREMHPHFRLIHGRVIDDAAPLGERDVVRCTHTTGSSTAASSTTRRH